MSFACPRCGQDTLQITASIRIPPGLQWDEELLQTVACVACGLVAVARYSESHRGAMGQESVWHRAEPVTPETYSRVREAIRQGLPDGVPRVEAGSEPFTMTSTRGDD